MIQKNIQGRLGNQMFQYAATKGILQSNNIDSELNLCFSDVYKNDFKNDLKNFNLKKYKEITKIQLSFPQALCMLYIKIYEIFLKFFNKDITSFEIKRNKFEQKYKNIFLKFGVVRLVDGYTEFNLVSGKRYLFSGSFESAKYFECIKKEIQEEFTPKQKELDSNKELYKIINSTNSVCISVRRGDFLSSEFKDKHYVCDMNYFKNAIDRIKKQVENPVFIVFSDDIDWCKKEFSFLENVHFESGKDPVWEKLRLMYSCRHFIISNSTFSWWAQYLSRNENKVVVAPSKWKNFGYNEDIYQKEWDLI